MRLRQLHEAESLQATGNKIARAADEEKVDVYERESNDFAQFVAWLSRPNPEKWEAIANNLRRFGTELYRTGEEKGEKQLMRDGRIWNEIANLDAARVVAAMAAAPDGASRGSEIDNVDLPDGLTTPLIDQMGEQAFLVIAAALSANIGLRDRVFKAIHGGLGTLNLK